MLEHRSPELVPSGPADTINTLLADRVTMSGDAPFIERQASPGGPWEPVTAREFDAAVVGVAKGLIARGVGVGDRVGIMSRTRYEWTLLDFAAWAAGAVVVPLYETSSAEQVQWILSDGEVKLLVVESAEHRALVDEVRSAVPTVTDVLTIDDGAVAGLTAAGSGVADAEVATRRAAGAIDDLATIIYTSGTTGRPKGTELTHRNFVELARNAVAGLGEVVAEPGARTLLFMPLAHVFARFIEVLCVPAGCVLGHTPDTKTLVADLGTFRPTFILSVPRVFEKVYNSAEQKAMAGGKGKIFQWAARVAIAYSRALDEGGPGLGLKIQHKVADTLVLSKLRAALGGQAQWAISGGAALGERLGHFYRGLGLNVLEGYGLTETTAPATVNRPGRTRIGTVGIPLPGTAVRIAEDGEILIQGPHVTRGYRGNEEATREAFDGDWFRSGDLGSLDDDGFLRITGRKKEILVTAGGKNVAPAVLEDRIRAHPLVSQCMLVGDARPFVAALITLDPESLPGWLSARGLPAMDVAAAIEDPTVHAALEEAVERANKAVSRAESVRKFTVLPVDFTIDNGYLTPSLKVRRGVVYDDFTSEIEHLYASAPSTAEG